jgi:Zn-finger nucleic acid-binding protein
VDLDMCFNCKGLWVDAGELASFERQLREAPEKRGTVMSALLNIFKND